jgi:transglutaminase-like putative cysteine protease
VTLLASPVETRSIALEQRIRYEYSAPISSLRQRLIVVPPAAHGDQRRTSWSIDVEGAVDPVRRTRTDHWGNVVVELASPRVDHAVEFVVRSAVDRLGARRPQHVAVDPRLCRTTPLTQVDDVLLDLTPREATPAALCGAAHRSLTYEWGITGVHTTAAEAVRGGRGVCQDFAHVMIALCRAAGVTARYVSGHLLGEGGSHAWVEVLVADPDLADAWQVEAWDPTHDRRAHDGYVTVAVGRDYRDVAPMSGTFDGDGVESQLTVRKAVHRLDA